MIIRPELKGWNGSWKRLLGDDGQRAVVRCTGIVSLDLLVKQTFAGGRNVDREWSPLRVDYADFLIQLQVWQCRLINGIVGGIVT